MDGAALCRVNQLRALTTLLERSDAASQLSASRLAEIVECLAQQQLLLEPHDDATTVGQGAGAGLPAQPAPQQLSSTPQANAVAAWVAAVQKLLNRNDAQAAATVLLGATASCCTLGRLAASFGTWATLLCDLLKKEQLAVQAQGQGQANTDTLRACLVSLAQVFSRLQEMMHIDSVRRDGSSLASRAVAAAMSILTGGSSSPFARQLQGHKSGQGHAAQASGSTAPSGPGACTIAGALALPALELVFAVLSSLPSSIRQHATVLEAALAAVAAGRARLGPGAPFGSGAAVRQGAARCLALLPRVQGSAEAWSELARRAMLSLAEATDAAFMGLGDEGLAARAREALGGASEALLGPLPTFSSHNSETGALKQLRPALDTLAAMLALVEQLLVGPFPAPVPLPGNAILLALHRLLRLDEGAVLAAGRVPPSSSMFSELCAAMPSIRSTAWRLFAVLLAAGGPSLCSQHALMGAVAVEGLRRLRARGAAALAASPPSERRALYAAAAAMATHGGLAAGRQLASEALAAASVELFGAAIVPDDAQGHGQGFSAALQAQRPAKKQRQVAGAGGAAGASVSPAEDAAAAAVAAGAPDAVTSEELGSAAAAVGMLAAIVQVSGPLLTTATRARYDALAAHIATSAKDAATAASRDPRCSAPQVHAIRVLQRETLSLLLATVLAPCGHRPSFLGQALRLFRQGRCDGCPDVASFCASAALSCESLLHPRSLPMAGIQQYTGMQDVAPLVKPRMWSVLDPVVLKPVAPADSSCLTGAAPAPAQPHASTQPAAVSIVAQPVVGSKRPLPQAQEIQRPGQHQQLQQPVLQPVATPPHALSAVAQAKEPASRLISPAPAAPPVHNSAPQPTLAAAVAPVQPVRPAAAAAASVFADAAESSDSEGSLPDIDSGGDDDDDDDS